MSYQKRVLGQQLGAYVFKDPPLVIANHSLSDVSAGSQIGTSGFGGPYRYFRFQGVTANDAPSEEPCMIAEIDFTDDSNNNHPTHFDISTNNNSPDAGGTDTEGPYTNSAVTVSAGYSHSKTYGPFRPFDGHPTNQWWTLGLGNVAGENSNLNYLDVDFGPTNTNGLDISSITIKFRYSSSTSYHKAIGFRVEASNDSNFATSSRFGFINFQNTDNLTGDGGSNTGITVNSTFTLNVGKILTVGASASTTESDVTYSSNADYTRGVVTQNTNTYMSGNYMRGSSRLFDKLI